MTPLEALLARIPAASPFGFDLNARRCLRLALGAANRSLPALDLTDAAGWVAWIEQCIAQGRADYAAGGYAEDRTLYRQSVLFDSGQDEPRTVHLGIDLWLAAGSPVHAALPGVVHSVRDNAAFGDYGPTLVLEHSIEGQRFYTLYGHLARRTLAHTRPGQGLTAGQLLGWLGDAGENGGWPPHLHFQIIRDMAGRDGDYPGVCAASQAAHWLAQCPDPNLLLRIRALA